MARTYEQLKRDAWERFHSIRDNGEEPSECHFLVTSAEHCTLFNQAPFFLTEMNHDRSTFFGMKIVVTRGVYP